MNLGNIPVNAILGVAGAGIGSFMKQKRELDHPSFGQPKSAIDYGKIAKAAVTYAKAYKEAKAKEEAAKAAEQTTETYNEDDIIDVEWRVVD